MSSTAPLLARRRPAPAWARLLLCAALLLGVGAMHTLGHVQEDGHQGHQGAHAMTAAVSTAEHPASDLPATDPMAVCLAIAALAVALLGVAPAAFSPWPGTVPRAPRVLRGPPRSRAFLPPAPSLARLQVLRI
ncbi:hypothetical protein DFP74_4876 [Nocardiopsis sp. Huas11]|uniref:DUF6153 family protein n=1 Tax=Nocardiopsis sp. Huas11 TaxID=2183912 RepID=UPI000EB5D507|nr:DUF6153 family protein [Nocardiopsis sp. Huas11]RKS09147.1 hypothetical protein DFP74_4876 [Nocardiopsis sp. Huas11]